MVGFDLVTGGTGTIGSELVRMLLRAGRVVRIFSRDEGRQQELQEALEREGVGYEQYRFFIGDVRDGDRLQQAMKNVENVYHLAALKHVLSSEYNPGEAVKTNIFGVQNVVEAACAAGVKCVVGASSDKAASPNCLMGATKLVGERLLIQANARGSGCRFIALRFGNVMGSRGSVLPRWRERLRLAGELLVTEPKATRFVMSIRQAAELTLWCARNGLGGEVFVQDMPCVLIGTLVAVVAKEHERRHNLSPLEVAIKVVGLRPGETLDEVMAAPEELPRTVDLRGRYAILPNISFVDIDYNRAYGSKPKATGTLCSSDCQPLDESQTRNLLAEWGLL